MREEQKVERSLMFLEEGEYISMEVIWEGEGGKGEEVGGGE